MNWGNAPEAFIQALKVTGAVCLSFISLWLLLWLATVSVSAAIIIVFMLWLIIFDEVDKWPTN